MRIEWPRRYVGENAKCDTLFCSTERAIWLSFICVRDISDGTNANERLWPKQEKDHVRMHCTMATRNSLVLFLFLFFISPLLFDGGKLFLCHPVANVMRSYMCVHKLAHATHLPCHNVEFRQVETTEAAPILKRKNRHTENNRKKKYNSISVCCVCCVMCAVCVCVCVRWLTA